MGDLAGVVLAGGRSRRFGRDKTALCVPRPAERTGEKGQSLVLRAAGVLERLLGDPGRVFVSCRPFGGEEDEQGRRIREEAREHGYGIVEDLLPEGGTLRAVYSALEGTRRACLVMPCDLPCMDEATLGELLAFRRERRLEPEPCLCSCFFFFFYGATQPLVAVYELEALRVFRRAVEEERYKLATVVPPELMACLRYGAEKEFFFQNVNFPEDWEHVRSELARSGACGEEMPGRCGARGASSGVLFAASDRRTGMFFQRLGRTQTVADRIVIVGAGEVGFHISRRLAAEGRRVLLIDLSRERLAAVEEELDVQTLQGSGTTPSVLRRAEVESAAMFLAVTDSDETNIVSCLFAGELAPNLTKLARIRHPEYADMPALFAKEPLNINMMVNPEEEVVRSIERQLTLPGAMEYAEFADGTLRMASMRIEGAPLAGQSLKKFPELAGDPGLMVGAINRDGRLLIPSGRDTLEKGDVVYFVFLPGSQPSLLRMLRRRGGYPSSACIVGGGDIGFRLARLFERRQVDVKIIDRDAARCEFLAEHLGDALVLHGDGTDADLLRQENVGRMDAFISVTDDEENNMLACLLARSLGVAETVVRVDKAAYLPLVEQVGIGHSVSPRLSAVNSILHYFRQGRILSSVAVGGEAAEMMEALVEKDAWLEGRAVHELGLPRGVLLIGVSRGGETRIPSGGTVIREGDTIAILCLRARVSEVESVLARKKN